MADMSASHDVKLAGDSASNKSTRSLEYEPRLITAKEWAQKNITNDFFGKVKRYLISLFPIFSWIYRYNLTWALGGIVSPSKSSK